jgi:hypothetical protein
LCAEIVFGRRIFFLWPYSEVRKIDSDERAKVVSGIAVSTILSKVEQ